MKSIPKSIVVTTAIVLYLCVSFTVTAQKFPIIIADSVNKWSEPTIARIVDANNKLATLEVFVKVKKFKGTTADCEVFFRNIGTTTISAFGGLQTGDKPASQSIYVHNAGHFNLKPGYEISFNLELRECWPKGGRGLNAAAKCAICAPNICFAEVKIN